MNFGEAAKISSVKFWSLTGSNRIVKVVSAKSEMALVTGSGSGTGSAKLSAKGYVTQEKYLYGKTAGGIERILGLRPGELSTMCYVYSFARLPTLDEVEFKFTCAFPDGKPFEEEQAQDLMQKRDDFSAGRNLYDHAISPVAQYYPPGSNMVPQWRLKTEVPIKERVAAVFGQLVFQRKNGSVKPYTPHNRSEIR